FTLLMNPNLKGVTEEDLQEQFDLAMKIIEKESLANEAVIEIREIQNTIKKGLEKRPELRASADGVMSKITVIENDLYQTKNQSPQDPLNFPIKLNNRLSSLRRSVERGDAKPTDGAYKVFEELSAELSQHLAKYEAIKTEEWAALKSQLGM
ncbi:MAG: glycosyl hydrolase, partial [Cyclobacteriaceae bacterium]